MDISYNLLAPGPVNLHPQVQKALALPMIHHRTPEFDKILARVLSRLKKVFATEQPVFVMSATGSGGMEALLVNTMRPGDKVLGIDSGKFGERWGEMVSVFSGELIRHKVDWGQAVKLSDVKRLLDTHKDIRILICQACETSTAVLHPIEELGALIRNYPNVLFLVDGITALGALPINMDEWGIDGLVGGSQKAFMLPTGLTLFSFSKKAWGIIEKNPTPRFYFDVRRELKANKTGETFFSSNVTLIRALDVVLDLIDENKNGLADLFSEIEKRAQFTRKYTAKLGLSLYSERPSPSLTALKVPTHLDGQKIRSQLEEKFKITIMGGQDHARGKIIRIGHMGYITWLQMKDFILALGSVLNNLDPSLCRAEDMKSLHLDMLEELKKYNE